MNNTNLQPLSFLDYSRGEAVEFAWKMWSSEKEKWYVWYTHTHGDKLKWTSALKDERRQVSEEVEKGRRKSIFTSLSY